MKKKFLMVALAGTMLLGMSGVAQAGDLLTKDSQLYESTNTRAKEEDFVISGNVLEQYNGHAEEVVIPEGVSVINSWVFSGDTTVRSVTLPSTITEIGFGCFSGCRNLKTINNVGKVSVVGGDSFEGTAWLEAQRNNNPLVVVGKQLIDGKTAKGKVVIPDTVEKLTDYCFENATEITEVVCPKSVTSIGYGAFKNSGLTKFTNQRNDISLSGNTFWGCTQLKEFRVTDGMSLGWSVFNGCTGLERVYLGNYEGSIGVFGLEIPTTVKDIYSNLSENSIYVWHGAEAIPPLKEDYPNTNLHFSVSSVNKLVADLHGITISWGAIDKATQYAVYIKKNDKWNLIGNTKDTSYYYYVVGEDMIYAPFTVRAMVDGKYIAYDTEGYAGYEDDKVYIAPPRNLNVSTTAEGIRFTYNPLTVGIVHLEIQRKLEQETDDQFRSIGGYSIQDFGETIKETSYVDKTAKTGVKYTYRFILVGGANSWIHYDLHNIQMAPKIKDVASTASYAKAVAYAAMRGIMNGTTATTFAPKDQLTRAQYVTILWNLEGHPQAKSSKHFTDVASTKYYAQAVNWAFEKGIVNGRGDGTFGPNVAITRQDFVVLLMNYAKYKKIPTQIKDAKAYMACSDYANVSPYALSSIQWGYENGLIGAGGKLTARDSINRGQAASIMQRFMVNYSL